jgi:hypothetical protein
LTKKQAAAHHTLTSQLVQRKRPLQCDSVTAATHRPYLC